MKRLSLRVAIAIFTFIIGVATVTIWLIYHRPAIRSYLISYQPKTEVTFCNLVNDPDRYDLEMIRVQAILIGYHELVLYSPACENTGQVVRADFDSTSRQKLIKAIDSLNGAGFHDGNFWARATLTGRFEKITNEDHNLKVENSSVSLIPKVSIRLRLNVLNVEQVETVPPAVPWPE